MGPLGLELELDPGLEWNNLTQNKNGIVGPGIRMGQLDLGLKWPKIKIGQCTLCKYWKIGQIQCII